MDFLATSAFFGLILPAIGAVQPIFISHDTAAWEDIVLPGLMLASGPSIILNVILEAYNGVGMLVATLVFKKELNQLQ
jgi:hypothetical protein